MPQYTSRTMFPPEVYRIDFKGKVGEFHYKRKIGRIEILLTQVFSKHPSWFYLLFIANVTATFIVVGECGIFAVGGWVLPVSSLMMLIMVFGGAGLFFGLLSSYDAEPERRKLKLPASTLASPTQFWLRRWGGLNFWYDGDVAKRIREATVEKQYIQKGKRKRPNGWLVTVRFDGQPTDGTLEVGW